ncbi:hypothetical protein C2G38_2162152 [Gigaspora rosea]|uniref:Uncharacterized protein n=1 Tax=Gigaspora rosea TaxID=44941 RepID=A0A397W6B9_9GLOM|nr:hypothetical protein C2G38_2162152 [Gigaspora rosea]
MVTANFKDGVTVLGNGGVHIFLLGGVQQDMKTFGNNATNSSLWSYNINSQRWDIVVLPNPSPGEVANLISMNEVTPNNQTIFILGGTQSYGLAQTTPHPVFLLLDVKSEPFQYSSLQPSSSISISYSNTLSKLYDCGIW